MKKIETSI